MTFLKTPLRWTDHAPRVLCGDGDAARERRVANVRRSKEETRGEGSRVEVLLGDAAFDAPTPNAQRH